MSGEDLTDVYYLALLYHLGCTASADRQAQVAAGDDVSSRRWFSEADYTDRGEFLRLAATVSLEIGGPLARAQAVAGLLTAPKDLIVESFAAICEVGARLGAGPRVTKALQHAYARWTAGCSSCYRAEKESRSWPGSSTWSTWPRPATGWVGWRPRMTSCAHGERPSSIRG